MVNKRGFSTVCILHPANRRSTLTSTLIMDFAACACHQGFEREKLPVHNSEMRQVVTEHLERPHPRAVVCISLFETERNTGNKKPYL